MDFRNVYTNLCKGNYRSIQVYKHNINTYIRTIIITTQFAIELNKYEYTWTQILTAVFLGVSPKKCLDGFKCITITT